MNRKIAYNHIIDVDKLNGNSVIIDAGTNLGGFIEFIRKIEQLKDCKIITIECSPTLLDIVKKKDLGNTVLIEKALMDVENKVVTYTEFVGENNNDGTKRYHEWGNVVGIFKETLKPRGVKINEYDVTTTSLSEIINDNNIEYIDYLKMDIEGSEYPILFNMNKKIADKIGQMSIETHLPSKNAELIKHLKTLGFKVEEHTGLEIYAFK